MDFMEARRVTEPSAPEVEPAREDDLDEIFDCAQRFVADCRVAGQTGKGVVPEGARFDPGHPGRWKNRQHGAHRAGHRR